jgi:hypothetical protein
MITQISYNVLIERFRAFASGHYLIEAFTHGELSQTDLEKDQRFPWMHVFPVEVEPRSGSRLYTFVVTFADLPRDKETNAEYQRESLSDCIKLAEDLLAEIQNGLVLFGPTVELEGSATIEPFIKEFTHTLTGVNLTLTISVPWNWDACDIPANFAVGGSGSGGSGSGGGGILLETNGVVNGDQTLLNLQEGENITIVDNGFGTVTISATGGGGDDVATEFNVNHTTATGNQYVIGDRVWYLGNVYQCIANNDALLPTNTLYWSLIGAGFRLRQTPVDWNATSGDFQILNKPTIPAAQVNSDWNAVSGVAQILNKPTLAAVATSGDYNDLINPPTIPSTLDDLSDVNAPAPSNGQVLSYNSTSGDWEAVTPASGGSVTSVGLTMPSAFAVSGSPVTTAGTLAVTGAGLATQYVRGDGQLANFPTTSGGGSSVSYYLNGSINQGTIGGSTYYQMSKTAVFGAGTDFTRTNAQGNGLIAQFITDVNDPNVLLIPGGNFNLEIYFSASSGGGSPSFYVELYKYDGAAFTLLATDVATPEGITQGTVIDAYFTALAVPPTVMALTDRLALRVFVTTSGRTIVLHTEDNHLSQVITTLSTGINAINGLTAQVQNLATGTAGTDFAISSSVSTHTFNLPTASAANRGALSSADWSTFNSKQNNIGLTTVGNNLATLANPSAISYIRINADNTTTTRTPSQVLSDLGISNPLSSVTLTSDVTISAVNTSLADVTGLSFPITAGTSYRFRAELQVITSASGTGMKFAVNANAGVSSINYRAISVGATAGVQVFWSSFTLDSSTGVTTATVTNQYVTIEGLVTGNNNGTVIMRFGKMIAAAGSLTVKAGSILTYQTV